MKINKGKLLKAFFCLLTAAALTLPLSALGLASGGIGILPGNPDPTNPLTRSWFIYTMNGGEIKEDAVNIFNESDDEIVAKVYPVDGTTTADGNFTLVSENAEQVDVGSWIQLYGTTKDNPILEVGLKPHEIKKIPFVISIPADVWVGDHLGGLIVQEISRGGPTNKPGMSMSIVTRIGARIYLTVPGEKVEKLTITEFGKLFTRKAGSWWRSFFNLSYYTEFLVNLKNDGNVRAEPEVKINIKNIFGQPVEEIGGKIGLVFPFKSSLLHLPWQKQLFFGRFVAEATVKFGDGRTADTKTVVFWAVPYKLLTILGGLIVLLILIRLIILYFAEAAKEKMAIYTMTKKETIQGLSEKFKVNWSKLARINKIKEPYELKKGQKIFVPTNRRNQELLKVLLEKGIMEPSIQAKLGDANKSIFYKIHRGKKSLKFLFIGVIILIVGGGLTWIFFTQAKHQNFNQTTADIVTPEAPEDTTRTKKGVLKRSEIKIAINNNASTADNVDKLYKKLQFIGFQVEKVDKEGVDTYSTTTIEYQKDKLEAASDVRVALALNSGDVNLIEKDGLEYEIFIPYFIGEIFDLSLPEITQQDLAILQQDGENGTSTPATPGPISKDTITVVVMNGGGKPGQAGQTATTIRNAGYPKTSAANANNFNYQGVTISYKKGYQTNAEEIKNLLKSSYANITLSEKTEIPADIQVILGS